MKLLSKYILIFALLIISNQLYATHNRAGEITYTQISELSYEITIITYTSTGPGWTADRPELEISWGDNETSILPRIDEVYLPNYYKRNKYIGTHTFPGPGIYELLVEDPNRNEGVNNIPNSVNVVFSISTILQISAELGTNNTPILTQPPIDKGAVGQIFIHNPGAYDPDGDSISYALTICRGENGEPIEGYSLPESSNSLTINPVTGDLVWDAPVEVGVYNIAILIEEWRNNYKIGKIIRDMQIEIYESDDTPPNITTADKHCVEADSLLFFEFTASDSDGDEISMTANGAPFLLTDSYAVFDYEYTGGGQASAEFTWQTECRFVRTQPYLVNFKAIDNSSPVNLVYIKNVSILVIGPKTEILSLEPSNNSMTLTWKPNRCTNVSGYDVYRKNEPVVWEPGECDTGIPDSLGYQLIGNTTSWSDTIFLDNNKGIGLPQGFTYCYRIVARFEDGAESYASEEICNVLTRGIPTITNVSVEETDTENGEIYLAWSKPTEFDTTEYPGPYKYLIYHSEDLWGENLQLIDSTENINDTIFNHYNINTKEFSHSYLVEFWNVELGKRELIGTPNIASSIFLEIQERDNKLELISNKNVPWENEEYSAFRLNSLTNSFDSIGTSETIIYIDSLLSNGEEYCYKIRSTGEYSNSGYINPIINWSQINCGTPQDTIPPCPPIIKAKSICDSLYNQIQWSVPDSCLNDIYKYNIYFSPNLYDPLEIIDSVKADENSFTYLHYPEEGMAGCYYMTTVDSFFNESTISNKVCVDECYYYELPNVFTPNNDNINDYYHPKFPYYFVDHIEMTIYNCWGQIMFETTDPDIMWDGRYQKNNKLVTTGVYYYLCDVYEYRLTGLEPRHLDGFIHVFSNNKNGNTTPDE